MQQTSALYTRSQFLKVFEELSEELQEELPSNYEMPASVQHWIKEVIQ